MASQHYPLHLASSNPKSMETLQVTALFPHRPVERVGECLRVFPRWRWHHFHSISTIKACTHISSPYPTPCHLHPDRGDLFQKIIKRVRGELKHSYFPGITLQPPGCPWAHREADIHRVPLWHWHQGSLFGGERTNTSQGFLKGELSPSENPCDEPPTDSRTSQAHDISLSWPSWKTLHYRFLEILMP